MEKLEPEMVSQDSDEVFLFCFGLFAFCFGLFKISLGTFSLTFAQLFIFYWEPFCYISALFYALQDGVQEDSSKIIFSSESSASCHVFQVFALFSYPPPCIVFYPHVHHSSILFQVSFLLIGPLVLLLK